MRLNFLREKISPAGDGAPVYKRGTKKPAYLDSVQHLKVKPVEQSDDLSESFTKIFTSPNIVSKQWVYEQYDYMVRTNTVIQPGGDAAVIRIKGTNKALSVKTDCNARYVYLDPYSGAAIAVAESARNVVCTGAKPVAITNCLNFGNPYKPEVYWQFEKAISGMGDACRVLETPVTGGNVSFYNESETYQVYPTPVIGMLGVIEDISFITPSAFQKEGDLVYLIGETFPELGGSEYLKRVYNKVQGLPPRLDLTIEKETQDQVLNAIQHRLVRSCHDVSDGGLAVALAECCVLSKNKQLGLKAQMDTTLLAAESAFSESQSRFVVSVPLEKQNTFERLFSDGVPKLTYLGSVGGFLFSFNNYFEYTLNDLSEMYFETLPAIMNRQI